MYTNSIIPSRIAGLALSALLALSAAAVAQPRSDNAGPEQIGSIPGTSMLRDEFRARAIVQLNVASLNALAYRLIHDGNYALYFPELQKSESWNLALTNMFSGQPVRGIYFEPTPEQLTNEPVVGLPFEFEMPEVPLGLSPVTGQPSGGSAAPPTGGGTSEGSGSEDGSDQGGATGGGGLNSGLLEQAFQATGLSGALRVNPKSIRGWNAGDIYYYVDGDLLQLVMFAPDGSYMEYVDETPNQSKLNRITARIEGARFPDDWLAAQVLYFTEALLPQYYNMVEFMGSRETIPGPQFDKMDAARRLELAEELGVTVMNPFTRQPAILTVEFSEGDFIDPAPEAVVPLHLCLHGGRVLTHGELIRGDAVQPRTPATNQPEKPKKRPGSPPMGGRK